MSKCLLVLGSLALGGCWGTPAYAGGDCGDEVNLAAPGKPFGLLQPKDPSHPYARGIPVRTQGKRGICFSYAAAGLVDAWRFTHAPTRWEPGKKFQLSSPVALAVAVAKEDGRGDSFGGGRVGTAANFLRKHSCDHDALFAPAQAKTLHEDIYVQKLEAAWDEYNKYEADVLRLHLIDWKYEVIPRKKWDPEMIRLHDLYVVDQKLRDLKYEDYFWELFYTHGAMPVSLKLYCDLLENAFPSDAIPTLYRKKVNLVLAALLRRSTKVDFLANFFERACRGKSVKMGHVPSAVTVPEKGVFEIGDGAKVQAAVNKQLSGDDPQPVAVSICPSILEDSSRDWYEMRNPEKEGEPKKLACASHEAGKENPDGRHSVLVVGRRPKAGAPGKCEFLVRNSWGKSCDSYAKAGWTDCTDGDFWMDADRLSNNTYVISHLKK